MPFNSNVERWRGLASEESHGVPVDLVLAFMARESNGQPGLPSYTDLKYGYTLDEMACGLPSTYRRRALGLMQVAPTTWRSYVSRTGDHVSPCDLAGKGIENARRQIRIGAWALRQSLINVRRIDPAAFPWPEGELARPQILMGRLAYARGFAGLVKQLNRAELAGFPRTFDGLERFEPTWGHPDRPFAGARAVLAAAETGGGRPFQPGRAPAPWSPARPIRELAREAAPASDWIIGAALLAFLAWYAASRREHDEVTT